MDPLTAISEQIADAVAERVQPPAPPLEDVPPGIALYRLYSAKSVADLLDLSERSVRDIPEAMLPKTRTGPTGSSVRYYGINILCYMAGLPPVDVRSVLQATREAFLRDAQQPTTVRRIGNTGRRQVH